MGRLKNLLFLIYLFCAVLCFADQGYDIDNRIFIPHRYYVGDVVELRIAVQIIDEDLKIVLPEKEKLPVTEWIEIADVKYRQFRTDIFHVNVFFVTFKPGKHQLPLLDLGDLVLEGIEVQTQALLDERDIVKLQPRRNQLELPFTRLKIGIFLFIILIIPPLGMIFFKSIRKTMEALIRSRQRDLPKNKILRAIKRLRKRVGKIEGRQFYIQLAHIIREYLAKRLLIPALTSTTRELTRFFKSGIQDKQLRAKVTQFINILNLCDYIKFGGISSSGNEELEALDEVVKIVELIEEEGQHVES